MQIKRLSLEIFGGCNFTCQMCPQGEQGREKEFLRLMPFDLFENILEEAQSYGVQVVNLDGSGEATLNKDIVKYIDAVAKRGIKPLLYTNGLLVKNRLMREMFDAGLHICRFSAIGYNRETYKHWMRMDAFDRIVQHAQQANEYVSQQGLDAIISSYHLILENDKADWEVEQYKKNFIEPAGTEAEIWKMHNWAGTIVRNSRQGVHSTCGRPFSPDLTVRAGGLNGKHAAVVPCCQTMGAPKESTSVLGHLEDSTIEQVFNGDAYNQLRTAHQTGDWSLAPYCKGCDFLIDDPETLVYTNNADNVQQYNMRATDIDLNKYKPK